MDPLYLLSRCPMSDLLCPWCGYQLPGKPGQYVVCINCSSDIHWGGEKPFKTPYEAKLERDNQRLEERKKIKSQLAAPWQEVVDFLTDSELTDVFDEQMTDMMAAPCTQERMSLRQLVRDIKNTWDREFARIRLQVDMTGGLRFHEWLYFVASGLRIICVLTFFSVVLCILVVLGFGAFLVANTLIVLFFQWITLGLGLLLVMLPVLTARSAVMLSAKIFYYLWPSESMADYEVEEHVEGLGALAAVVGCLITVPLTYYLPRRVRWVRLLLGGLVSDEKDWWYGAYSRFFKASVFLLAHIVRSPIKRIQATIRRI